MISDPMGSCGSVPTRHQERTTSDYRRAATPQAALNSNSELNRPQHRSVPAKQPPPGSAYRLGETDDHKPPTNPREAAAQAAQQRLETNNKKLARKPRLKQDF